MPVLIVTSHRDDWQFEIPGVEHVDAWTYLTAPENQSTGRATRVFNLCRSYRYQSLGYYVSLLAEARGHKPMPGVLTLQDLKTRSKSSLLPDELDNLIQSSLAPLQSTEFSLSVYFGRNFAKRYERLALHLFNMLPVPLMKYEFIKRDDRWVIRKVVAESGLDIPESHRDFVRESAERYFSGRASAPKSPRRTRFDLAILHAPEEQDNAPSDTTALKRLMRAARAEGVYAELITRDDSSRLLEFDGLFIRETTAVNHHTYRFARRAANEGLVVIDDPVSILRCTNKVYLAEMLTRHRIDIPRSLVVHRDNTGLIAEQLGFPCVLKKPDSSFSLGVVKVASEEELKQRLDEFFGESELLVAQEYLPTTFDWRIGILDRKPLYACRYFMAPGHWQIIRQSQSGRGRYGKVETLPVELAPPKAVKAALKAANLIGDGLYGVDVKESNGRFVVIEVNDNPNINAGCEDAVLKDELYRRLIEVFVRRMEQKRARLDV
ncbi:MAG: RimK family protein [Planctomycetaceae bacterium]|nr:RimK family protein [Planctomycetaceae bacterium]